MNCQTRILIHSRQSNMQSCLTRDVLLSYFAQLCTPLTLVHRWNVGLTSCFPMLDLKEIDGKPIFQLCQSTGLH